MSNLNTKLLSALLKNESVDEVFRVELETAINELLATELTAFLNYEKYDPVGYNSGNSRNGYYTRILHSRFGDLNISVPRDRNGEFSPKAIPAYKRNTDDLETTIIQLYKKGITTREIADLIEKMYGHYYTPQTISNITKAVENQVNEFHNRPLANRYVVLYCDATYLNVRRDSVAKEALHIIVGITPEGNKEVLDYVLYPTESPANYKDMLLDLKNRGVEQVLLFVTDGLTGLREACLEVFPNAKHQSCWTHIVRNVIKYVRSKDRKTVLDDLKRVYNATSLASAKNELYNFLSKYQSIYPKIIFLLSDITSLFTFYEFPMEIRKSIYTTNIIENFNKNLKRNTNRKEQFPNEDSLDRYVCSYCVDYNKKYGSRVHKGFALVQAELNELFEN
ncbi:MAG: IS256 family transposase [Epulopiscium sp.]|jgi:transposase-like protein|nr:IS256 family transposase [Candidatus Epulonipiscium sp.]